MKVINPILETNIKIFLILLFAFCAACVIQSNTQPDNSSPKDGSGNGSINPETTKNENKNNPANININANLSKTANGEAAKPTPDKAKLQKTINESIKISLKKFGAEENGKRKIVYGDVDNDGDEDVVVQYDWDFGNDGGSGWGMNLCVFGNNDGEYEWVADKEVGGKSSRKFKLLRVSNGKIWGETLSDKDGTFACDEVSEGCLKKTTYFTLKGSELIEK